MTIEKKNSQDESSVRTLQQDSNPEKPGGTQDTDNAKSILVDRFDEITTTQNKVLPFLASLMPKSTTGPEEGKKMQDNSSMGQAKKKGKSIYKTVKKVHCEESISEDNYDSDSFEYESAPDTPPLKRGKRAHEVSSDSDKHMKSQSGLP